MRESLKVLAIIFAFTLPALFLSRVAWESNHTIVYETATAPLPFVIILSGIQSLAFGLGIAFIVFGYFWMKKYSLPKNLKIASFFSISWLLVSWLPRNNLLHSTEMHILFQITQIAASLILIYLMLFIIKRSGEPSNEEKKQKAIAEKILGIGD